MNKNFSSGTLANSDTDSETATSNRGILNTFKRLQAALALHFSEGRRCRSGDFFQPYE
jgi:hypothetical protein